ncbi:MAG: choice-of-anchor J domain-containing protein [Muribaculaceae bacterium]|nr:choice-of-anchor J domain-containing protein [Muribaculaceae bacterium]
MKRFNFYLSLMLLLVFTAACSDEFDQPPMVIPTAEHTPNMTIAEFKAKHWQDDRNYIDTIKDDEVIHGWITSSDEEGNIYKQLYISDGTAGLTVSIDQSSIYTKYRIGQEVVIPMKGYFIGKFNGLLCLGVPYWYSAQGVWESNRMPMEMWDAMAEINGLPDVSKVDTTVIELSEIKGSDKATLLKYMSRLVRINGVTFTDGGKPFSAAENSTDREIKDEVGNTIMVSNSNYASFRANLLPESTVDIVGQLSYTASKGFFLLLRDENDVILNTSPGMFGNPYTVAEAIAAQNSGAKGWVGGYIVGAVAPEVTNVSSNADVEWKAPTTLDNTLVIADDPECKDYTKCIFIALPQGTPFREQANLKNNPVYYKKYLKAKGVLASYMGVAGITGNSGATDEFVLPFPRPVSELNETFDNALPTNWTEVVISGDKKWYKADFNGDGYAAMTGYNGKQPPFDTWFITPALDIQNAAGKGFSFTSETRSYGSTKTVFEVYLLNSLDPTTATVKQKLNPILAKAPNSTGTWSAWTSSGELDLSEWADGVYYIAFHYFADTDSEYDTWAIDNVKFGFKLAPNTRADFETMGTPQGSSYKSYTSTKGWEATNSLLFQGGSSDAPPTYQFIGFMTGSDTNYAMAPTLNGKTSAVGTLVSPTLKGGMKKLTFMYGAAFSDKNLAFRVDVKQNGSVVKTWEVNRSDIVTKTAYTFSENCNVNGDFTIEITNLCPSGSTSNKDRVSIWNLVWEQ